MLKTEQVEPGNYLMKDPEDEEWVPVVVRLDSHYRLVVALPGWDIEYGIVSVYPSAAWVPIPPVEDLIREKELAQYRNEQRGRDWYDDRDAGV